MASFNKVILVGNVTRDPEVRFTPGGTAVTDVGLAVNRFWMDKSSNERKEETTFIDVTLWGRTAEVAGEYLAKGRPCLIEGRLQLDQWDDKETGQKRSKLKVVGETLQLLGGRSDGGGGPSAPPQQSPQQRPAQQQAAQPPQDARSPDQAFYDDSPSPTTDDDVPF